MLTFKLIEPGDGYAYPFLHAWTKDIKNWPEERGAGLFLALAGGQFAPIVVSLNFPDLVERGLDIQYITEQTGAPYERAMVFAHMIKLLFKERKIKENSNAANDKSNANDGKGQVNS